MKVAINVKPISDASIDEAIASLEKCLKTLRLIKKINRRAELCKDPAIGAGRLVARLSQLNAVVAQSVEHSLGKGKVVGSNPTLSSKD